MPNADSARRLRGPRADAIRNNQLILQAAARILAEEPNASIQRIADEAGVVRLTVYRRYRNRDELRRAIFEEAATEVRDVIQRAEQGDADTLTALTLLITEMAATAQRYPLLTVGADLQPLPGQSHRPTPPPATRMMHQAIFTLIKRGQQEGVLRSDLPAELLPLAISGTLNLVMRFARTFRLEPDQLGTQVADLLLNGFSTGTVKS